MLVPVAELNYAWPGGPIEGTFTGRYGPDSIYLGTFTLRAKNSRELPEMLNQAVLKFDEMFEQALSDGKLKPDPTLNAGGLRAADPAIARLIEIGRAVRAREAAQEAAAQSANKPEAADPGESAPAPTPTPTQQASVVSSFVVQFASPDAVAIDATLATAVSYTHLTLPTKA